MVRQKLLRHPIALRLNELERSLVGFYADRFGRDMTAIIRGMIKQYVRADGTFEIGSFEEYLQRKVVPEMQGDEGRRAELEQQVADFLTGIKAIQSERGATERTGGPER